MNILTVKVVLNVGGWPIKCTAYVKGGHGSLSLQESIMQSCNVAMMRIGAMMGKDIFTKYQATFLEWGRKQE